MKTCFSLLIAFLLLSVAAPTVRAQVEISCQLNYKKYLLFEPILAKIKVKNISGRQFTLAEAGSEAAIFSMDVQNSRGYEAERKDTTMIETPVVLQNQESTEFYIYINSAYTVNKIDTYTAKAVVRIGDRAYSSNKSFFDTHQGTTAAQLATQEPDRRYSIRKISRTQKGTFLYLRIDDGSGKMNYGVHILDTMVPVFKPRMTMDGKGNIHTLHRKSPQQFVEVIVDPNAEVLERNYYRSGFGEVNFMRDEAGQIRVDGLIKITP